MNYLLGDRVRCIANGQTGWVRGSYIRPSRLVGHGQGARRPRVELVIVETEGGHIRHLPPAHLELDDRPWTP